MVKKKIVKVKSDNTRVTIMIQVANETLELTRGEMNSVVDHLASKAMLAIADAPYVRTPISKIKVGNQ